MRKSIFVFVFALILCSNTYAFHENIPMNDVSGKGNVFVITDAKYTEYGNWTDSQYSGYDNNKMRISAESGAVAEWTNADAVGSKYEVYIWKSVLVEGDKNAKAIVTTNTEAIEKSVDFSEGYTGWVRVGVVNFADAFGNVRLVSGGAGMPVSAFKYVKTTDEEYYVDRIFDKNSDLLVLKKDSLKTLHNHEYKFIEDVSPTIINNTMMIPLRFVSENMGYDCIWNAAEQSVSVKKDEKTIVFKINSESYSVNGEVKTLEQAPVITNSRTMLPVRALSEGLGNEVLWDESGVVLIGENVVVDSSISVKFYESINKIL